jgi:hypothetical protein
MIRLAVLATATVLLPAGLAAMAEGLRPASAHSLDLGPVAGVAYYTLEKDGFRVVTTVSPTHTTKPMRFTATLLPGQSVSVSLPLARDGKDTIVHIARIGDGVRVRHGSPIASTAN